MDAEIAWDLLATERRAFADQLDSLNQQQWESPSLCGEWTVREVATHMMAGQTGTFRGFMSAMLKARGRFSVANQVLVDRRSSRPTSEIAGDLRSHAAHRFAPPTMDWHAPLTDFLVHRLDVTVPLGLSSDRPRDGWTDALDFIVSKKAQMGFMDSGLPALAYRATDVDWAYGDGDAVHGPAEALALALTRRPVRLDELDGAGAAALTVWAGGR